MALSEGSAQPIFLTGSSRSGTSLIARILASCSSTCFAYEPATIGKLIAYQSQIEPRVWEELFETYLYEEVILGSLSGRTLNLNTCDESSCRRYLLPELINQRLAKTHTNQELVNLLRADPHVALIKWPDLVPSIALLKRNIPRLKIISTFRNIYATINSLLRKRWFKNPFDFGKSQCRMISIKAFTYNLPIWLSEGYVEWWIDAAEIERALFYYALNLPHGKPEIDLVISYDELLKSPHDYSSHFISALGLHASAMTSQVINSVDPQRPHSHDSIEATIPQLRTSAKALPQEIARLLEI